MKEIVRVRHWPSHQTFHFSTKFLESRVIVTTMPPYRKRTRLFLLQKKARGFPCHGMDILKGVLFDVLDKGQWRSNGALVKPFLQVSFLAVNIMVPTDLCCNTAPSKLCFLCYVLMKKNQGPHQHFIMSRQKSGRPKMGLHVWISTKGKLLKKNTSSGQEK